MDNVLHLPVIDRGIVLVNKFGDEKNDYDSVIIHQRDVRLKMLDKLAE